MGDTIRGSDFECRYVREGPVGEGGFTRLVRSLGIELPLQVSIRDAVRYRWITPTLRIALPREYFEDWTEFPLWSRTSKVRSEHRWADLAVRGDFAFPLLFSGKQRLGRNWYLHPFDTQNAEVLEMLAHTVSADLTPEPFKRRNAIVYPYVDFFPYWETYRLMESVQAAELFHPIPNTPSARVAAKGVVKHFDNLVKWSNGSLERIRRRFTNAASTFEWVSLYRTLLGAAVHGHRRKLDVRAAEKRLFERVNRTTEALKDELRDVLLTLWEDWHVFDTPRLAPGAERLLQQDIKRAVDFIDYVSGTPVDYRDPRWYVTDGNRRPWAQLSEALPFEIWLARESFPRQAAVYLRYTCRLLLPQLPRTEAELRAAVDRNWQTSYGLRRFTILFRRMHDLINKDRQALVTFTDTNPVDYMILGCLVVERMVTERWKAKNPKEPKVKSFDVMLASIANELTTLLGLTPVDVLLDAHKESAKLYTLKRRDRLPLLPTPRSRRQFVFRTLHNLRVLRNYSAHHDCLDFELSFGREGRRAMRAIVGSVSLILALP